jgi:hypothetical protein
MQKTIHADTDYVIIHINLHTLAILHIQTLFCGMLKYGFSSPESVFRCMLVVRGSWIELRDGLRI